MKYNYFSITFWFNLVENHQMLLADLNKTFETEFASFNVLNEESDNLLVPVVSGVNKKLMTNFSFSKINFQYNMDHVSQEDFGLFKEKCLKIYEFFENNNIIILHSAICVNGEIDDDKAFNKFIKSTLNSKLITKDLIDASLKLGKKHEDLFYKIITLLNKKQIKLPQKVDKNGNLIPVPLISWNEASLEKDIVEISYEINDKYSFDFTKNYHTTEFFLNKMLYVLENDLEKDVNNLIKKGIF